MLLMLLSRLKVTKMSYSLLTQWMFISSFPSLMSLLFTKFTRGNLSSVSNRMKMGLQSDEKCTLSSGASSNNIAQIITRQPCLLDTWSHSTSYFTLLQS